MIRYLTSSSFVGGQFLRETFSLRLEFLIFFSFFIILFNFDAISSHHYDTYKPPPHPIHDYWTTKRINSSICVLKQKQKQVGTYLKEQTCKMLEVL